MASVDFRVKNGLTVDGNATVAGTSLSLGTSTAALTTATVGGAITGNILKVAGTTSGTANITTDVTTGIFNIAAGITTGTVNIATGGASTTNIGGAAASLTVGTTSGNSTLTISGNATSGSATLTTNSGVTTANIFNTNATNINAFGAGTAIGIGTNTGYVNIYNPTIRGSYATQFFLNGTSPSIKTTSTGTASVFNDTALTGNLFAESTTVNIGYTGSSTAATYTQNYSTGYVGSGATKTINIGTAGIGFSTTNVNIGSNFGGTTTFGTPTININISTGNYQINGTSVLNATTLGSNVVNSSLTTVGTIGTGVWNGTIITGTYGGTGVNNGTKTITLGGNLTTSGSFTTTLTVGANTNVTLPASGTLVGSNDSQTVTNTMLAGSIANAKLTNSSITIGTTTISLGSSSTTLSGVTSIDGGSSVSQTLTLQSTTGVGTSDSIVFKVGNNGATTAMTITTGGAVGIGSIATDYGRSWNLVVRKDQNATTQIGVINANTGASAVSQITKITGTNNSYLDWGLWDNAGSPYDSFTYGAGVTYTAWSFGGTERMRLTAGGNVGIGTTPSYRLDVSAFATGGTASASPSIFRVLASTLGTVAGNDINFGGYQANTGADASRLNTHIQRTATGTDWTTTAMGLSYDVDTTVGAGGQLWFYNGNVGIGTSSPSYSLVVSKNQNAATVLQTVNNNTGASAAVILQSQIGASSYVNYTTSATYNQIVGSGITTQYIDFDTQIFRNTAGTERFRIDASGNVGIGTSSNLDKLTVAGGIKSTSSINTAAITANSTFVDNLIGARMLSYGPNTTTNGTFVFYQGKSDNSSGQTAMSIDSNGNVSMTGTISASNINRTYGLPNVAGTASWIKLGTFTASNSGNHCFIKVVTSCGYNAVTAQQNEVYIHFLTSNGVSVDANGFAGFTQFYITNTAGISYNVKVVGNAAGVSATSYDIWFYQAGSYNGNGSFYTVEINNGNTWTNIATTGSDPGVASSTIGIGVNAMGMGSNILPNANNSINLGSDTLRWSGVYSTNFYRAGTRLPTFTTASSAPSSPVVGDCWYKSTSDIFYQYVNDGTSSFWLSLNTYPSSYANLGVTSTLTVSGTVSSSLIPTGNNVYNLGSGSAYWGTIYGKATSAQYADLAEKYTADDNYEPGTVLEFGGTNEVTISNTDMSRKIAGIVSTNPGYLMNAELKSEFVVSLALTGRVPCKVQGKVRKGDMMVSASNGYARAEEDPKLGSVIGKALEDFDGITGIIEVVVGRL